MPEYPRHDRALTIEVAPISFMRLPANSEVVIYQNSLSRTWIYRHVTHPLVSDEWVEKARVSTDGETVTRFVLSNQE